MSRYYGSKTKSELYFQELRSSLVKKSLFQNLERRSTLHEISKPKVVQGLYIRWNQKLLDVDYFDER